MRVLGRFFESPCRTCTSRCTSCQLQRPHFVWACGSSHGPAAPPFGGCFAGGQAAPTAPRLCVFHTHRQVGAKALPFGPACPPASRAGRTGFAPNELFDRMSPTAPIFRPKTRRLPYQAAAWTGGFAPQFLAPRSTVAFGSVFRPWPRNRHPGFAPLQLRSSTSGPLPGSSGALRLGLPLLNTSRFRLKFFRISASFKFPSVMSIIIYGIQYIFL